MEHGTWKWKIVSLFSVRLPSPPKLVDERDVKYTNLYEYSDWQMREWENGVFIAKIHMCLLCLCCLRYFYIFMF